MIESLLPGLVFVIVFVATRNITWTITAAAVPALAQLAVRALQRQPLTGALSGVGAVGICLAWAWLSRDARNYYLPGFLTNAFWIVVLSATIMTRVPGIGVLVEYVRHPVLSGFRKWLAAWRSDAALLRAYSLVTLLWIGVFVLRLAVQLPLYLVNSIAWLGTARLVMGVPLFALTIWLSWLVLAAPMHRHAAAERVREAD